MGYSAMAQAALQLGTTLISNDQINEGEKDQRFATQQGLNEQRREFDTVQKTQAPYQVAGANAMRMLSRGEGMPGGNLDMDRARNDYTTMMRQHMLDLYQQGGTNSDTGVPVMPLNAGWTPNDSDVIAWAKDNPTYNLDTQPPGPGGVGTGDFNKKFSVDDFWKDPVVQLGYQSGLDLGTKALKNMAPLTTGLDSGAALKELTKFGTDYTGRTMAADSYARFEGDKTNVFNRLMAMAGGGQVANQVAASAGANMANNNTQLMSSMGNASAAAGMAKANNATSATNNLTNWWQQKQMMDRFFPNGGATTTPTNTGTVGYNFE